MGVYRSPLTFLRVGNAGNNWRLCGNGRNHNNDNYSHEKCPLRKFILWIAMSKIKKIHIYDPVDLLTINNIDSTKFLEWYKPIREKSEAELIKLFNFVQSMKLNGFLGVQSDSNFMLAVDLLFNAWIATIHNGRPFDQSAIDIHESVVNQANKLIESAEKTLAEIDKSTAFLFLSEHKTPIQNHLTQYIQELKERLEIRHSKDFYHYGLFYDNLGKKTARPGIKSVLAYRLVHQFRAYTSDSWDGIYQGQEMPNGGKPCFEVVASVVNLAFPDEEKLFSSDLVKKIIKQMTTNTNLVIRWGDWPNHPDINKGNRKGVRKN